MFKKYTKVQLALEAAGLIILTGALGFTALRWPQIPDIVPIHYDITGMPDAYGGKGHILVLAVLCIVAYGAMGLCQHYPRSWGIPVTLTDENRNRVYAVFKTYMIALKISVTGIFACILICSVRGVEPGIWFMVVSCLLIIGIVVVGIYRCAKM